MRQRDRLLTVTRTWPEICHNSAMQRSRGQYELLPEFELCPVVVRQECRQIGLRD